MNILMKESVNQRISIGSKAYCIYLLPKPKSVAIAGAHQLTSTWGSVEKWRNLWSFNLEPGHYCTRVLEIEY